MVKGGLIKYLQTIICIDNSEILYLGYETLSNIISFNNEYIMNKCEEFSIIDLLF